MAHWYFLAFSLLCLVCVAVHAWFRGKSFEAKENEENRRIRQQLHAQETAFRNEVHLKTLELKAKERFLEETRKAFERGYVQGRLWLARFLGEADKALDNYIALQLRDQHRTVGGAEEELGRLQVERRQLKDRLKFLEFQLASYKEYFPFLEDYDNTILDEAVQLDGSDIAPSSLGPSYPSLNFLSHDEYSRLDSVARDQLALDRYLRNGLSPAAVGALYDRFIGHLYERDGWEVRYQPVAPGVKGLAQDLICSKDDVIHVVHAKCWAPDKLIHQKHILQLFGTVQWLTIKLSEDQLFPPKIVPRFITTARLS